VSRLGSVPVLNRVTFNGNIKDELLHVEHWMVLFCVDWYDACKTVRQSYLDLASEHERKLNTKALLQLPVRFAEVDCRVDKVLCNEQLVDWYPEIVHYHRGDMVSRWVVGESTKMSEDIENMTLFLEEELNFTKPEEGEFDGKLHSNKTSADEDIWDLPLAQQHPLKTAVRLAPLAAGLVSMAVWVFTAGAEVLQGLRRLRGGQAPLAAADAQKKTLPELAPRTSEEGVRRRLPESWARERRSIEL